MPILTNRATHYRVVRPIAGSGYSVGDVVEAGEIKAERSLVALNRLMPSDGPATVKKVNGVVQKIGAAPAPKAIPATTAAVEAVVVEADDTDSDSDESSKRQKRRR